MSYNKSPRWRLRYERIAPYVLPPTAVTRRAKIHQIIPLKSAPGKYGCGHQMQFRIRERFTVVCDSLSNVLLHRVAHIEFN